MRPPISEEQKRKVLAAYAHGQSEREAKGYAEVSLGTAHGIIDKGRKSIGDLSELRSFIQVSKRPG